MKSLRIVLTGLAMFGMTIFLSGVSFAQETQVKGQTRHESKIKLLQDSVIALQQLNPDLARGLSAFANEETNESKEVKEGSKEKITKESPELKTKHEARAKLFKDAAATFQQMRPVLAKSLQEVSERKPNAEKQKMMQEKNEEEEAGEKIEPKSEQGENK